MSTDTALIEKREELKRRLAAGEYRTLVDVFLEWFDRWLRKMTRQSKPLPLWLITTIVSLTIVLVGFVLVYVAGDLPVAGKTLARFGLLSRILVFILSSVQAIVTAVIINHHIHSTFVLWQNSILDATEAPDSLNNFQDWLEKVCNLRITLLVAAIGGLVGGLYLVGIVYSELGVFVGYGFTIMIIILSAFSTLFVYLLFAFLLLSARLRKYDLKLFSADPSSSQLISDLSSSLNLVVYLVGAYAAIMTLLIAWIGLFSSAGIFLVIFLWLPIIVLFTVNHTSLSSLIRRVKWKTLNEIQAKVEKLQRSENFGNQETIDAIKRLMDYHDRVKATRDSALDFRTYLSFINSLLLPLLAFILGNLDLVLNLFARKP